MRPETLDANLSAAANDCQAVERWKKVALAETVPVPKMAVQEVWELVGNEANDEAGAWVEFPVGRKKLGLALWVSPALNREIMGQVMTRQGTIKEITRRLIDFYHPVRIYLFGSEARGESGPDSDLDFCVVLPEDAPESLYRDRSIHGHFWGLHTPVDVVRLPFADFDARAAHVVASLPATVVREGRLLYDTGRIAA